MRPRAVRSLPLPQLHPDLAPGWVRECRSGAGPAPRDRPQPDAVPHRVRRRPEGDALDAQPPGLRFHRRPPDRRTEPAAFDPDVLAGTPPGPDPPELLQPAVPSHRT